MIEAEFKGAGSTQGMAAKASEDLLRKMGDIMPVMIRMVAADERWFWFNRAWLDFTGRSPEQETGAGWMEGIHPDDRERCERNYAEFFQKREPFSMEYRIGRADGGYWWVLDNAVPQHGPGGEFAGFLVTCVDINGRKLAEQKLRESEENLRALVRATSQAVWIGDINGMTEDTSRFWENLTGQTREQSADWGWLKAVHPADQEQTRADWESAIARKEKFQREFRVRTGHGEYRHFEVSGVPVLNSDGSFRLWMGTMTDVTERIHADQALRSSEERLRRLVESATEFAIFTLSEDGRIRSWSEGAERVFGYTEAEAIGSNSEILFTWDDRIAGIPRRELEVAKMEGRAIDERWHVRKNGSVFFTGGAVSPIRDTDPPEFVKIARDLTTRKQMEDTLAEADRRKNEFLATLAHELRNPLAPIRSGLDLAKRARYERRMVEKILKIIERQTNQIVHLVDDLLDISRITQGKIHLKKERFELQNVVESVLETCREVTEGHKHRVEVEMPDAPIVLFADETRIEQVLVNIVNNAAKYTPPGGRIRVRVKSEEDEVEIRISDNGIGIPPGKLAEVFDIFSQVQEPSGDARSGLGIGLSVVKGLVQMHGGTVAAASAGEGKGSEFIIRLPLAANQEVRKLDGAGPLELDNQAARDEEPRKGKKILVVDDNVDAASMLQVLLTMEGHAVRTAYDGESGIKTAEEFKPSICLCDIGLPKLNGYEVAKRLRDTMPDALLISISGWGQDEDRQRSRESGFSHHLVKPVKVGDVISLLDG